MELILLRCAECKHVVFVVEYNDFYMPEISKRMMLLIWAGCNVERTTRTDAEVDKWGCRCSGERYPQDWKWSSKPPTWLYPQ